MQSIINFVNVPFMDQPIWVWAIFLIVIGIILELDLGLFNKKTHVIHPKESLKMCSIYAALACVFGGWIWYSMGKENGMDYFTGYLIEFSLSIDNIFVISLIFSFFAIPMQYQHRVLFYGILGAILLRGFMIIVGAGLIEKFDFILYFFGAFLLFSGVKMLIKKEKDENMSENRLIVFAKKHFRITESLHEQNFFVRQKDAKTGKMLLFATPLFLTLMVIEISDVIFAVDSIPAIFVITQHAFIVFSSNIFAVLGLRSLYFLLADAVYRFRYLKQALAFILIFIGSKIFLAWFGVHIPSLLSLLITLSLISGGVIFSLYKTKTAKKGIV